MALAYWSVRLASDDRDNGLVSTGRVTGQGVRSFRLEGGVIPGEEPATATLEVQARDAQEARLLATDRLGKLRERAGVEAHDSPVIWVARLADEPESSLRYRDQARELIDEERYELAVVAIQIHLEVHVRVLIEMSAAAHPSPALDVVISRQRSWGPHDRLVHPLLETLLGVKMTECPAWADYNHLHLPRRNGVVHRGQEIDAESAMASVETVSELWLWLNEAGIVAAGPV